MERHEASNIEAIKDCIKLIQKYPIKKCLEAAYKLCKALDEPETNNFELLHRVADYDTCLSEIIILATGKWGARNVLSALLFLRGDKDGHALNLMAYKYASERIDRELDDFFQS